jgi:hypothetical protein
LTSLKDELGTDTDLQVFITRIVLAAQKLPYLLCSICLTLPPPFRPPKHRPHH